MRLTKFHIAHRFLWMLIALHILNFSIDNPHTLFDNNTVDADFDEVDSVVELVLEDVMHIEDAIPEHHTKTPLNHKFAAKKMVWVSEMKIPVQFKQLAQVNNYRVVLDNTFHIKQMYVSPRVRVFSPPPEV